MLSLRILNSIIREGRNIYLTDIGSVYENQRSITVDEKNSIWSNGLSLNFGKEGQWLEDGKFARVGVSTAVFFLDGDQIRTLAIEFDASHPLKPNKLSPPAGIWEDSDQRNVFWSGLSELGEEAIITVGNYIIPWRYSDGSVLAYDWICEYAKDHNFMVSKKTYLDIHNFSECEDPYYIYLNGKYQGRAVLACEPETGSLEIIFLVSCFEMTVEKFLDGEKHDGKWLNRKVEILTLEELINAKNQQKTTSKMEAILEIFLKLTNL